MISTSILLAALLLPTSSLVQGKNIRGKSVEHDKSHKTDFRGDEGEAVGNKTLSTLIYANERELHGTLNTELFSVGPTPANKIYSPVSIHNGEVELTLDDLNLQGKHDAEVDSIISHEEKGNTEDQHSHRRLASTEIKIKNSCNERVDVTVVYRGSSGYRVGRRGVNANTESSAIGTTGDGEFFFYAKSNSHEWVGDSSWCFTGGSPCLKRVALNGNPTRFTYTIRCNSSNNNGGSNNNNNSNGGNNNNNNNSNNSGGGQTKTAREKQWLDEHNSSRRPRHGSDFVPMKWSNDIAKSAQEYADLLIGISGCVIQHGYRGNRYGGENLGANWGGGGQRPPRNVLKRWVDDEENLSFNQKLHYTQVIWKATEYVGCADASKSYNGGECHIQVCRYIRPGNCNVNAGNYQQKMLERNSPCTPFKPSDA